MSRRRIALITTGGTITLIGTSRLDLSWYGEREVRMTPEELVAAVPELAGVADVEVVQTPPKRSNGMTTADWLGFATTIRGLFARDDIDGVVITHGTALLEETAFFLDQVIEPGKPIVVTGSMLPASGLAAEGYLNLYDAVRTAAAPQSAGLGVLVVMSGVIWSAREVAKVSTTGTDAFEARRLGSLGIAGTDGQVLYHHAPAYPRGRRPTFDVTGLSDLPPVDVLVSHQGAGGHLIDASVAAGRKGIVIEGTGSGLATPEEDAALDRAVAAGVVVCHTSRVGAGRTVRRPSLAERRIVAAGYYTGWKARVLLSLCLTTTSDPDEIQASFDRY